MSDDDEPLLTVCIPTYNNAESLKSVLEHALTITDDDIEFLISDDGSTDETRHVVTAFEDERLQYVRNKTNLGFEKNLLFTVGCARGTYVLPLADEDRVVVESIEWILDRIRKESDIALVLGDFGWEGEWANKSWREAVPETKVLDGGREALLAFIREVPHPFAEHTWRRNYIGGFAVRKEILDLKAAEEYYGSAYIQNVLLLQAMTTGRTILTPRQLCESHYFEYKGENRFWRDKDWHDLRYRVRLQKYRMKLVDELIDDEVAERAFVKMETKFAAHLAVWAMYSVDDELNQVKETALNPEVRSLEDLWKSRQFYRLFLLYALLLPLPIPPLKRNLSHGYVVKRSKRVWFQALRRLLPEPIPSTVEDLYSDSVRPAARVTMSWISRKFGRV